MVMGDRAAAALGSLAGKFLSGGQGGEPYYKGMVDGANARRLSASAQLDEDKAGYIAEAIKRGLAGDYQGANVHSLYGYGGKTSFSPTSNGAVFNSVQGSMDTGTPIAAAFLQKSAADTAAKMGQAQQYYSAAGLNDVKAGSVSAMLPYEQQKLAGMAANYYAGAQNNLASANFRDQQALWEKPRALADVAKGQAATAADLALMGQRQADIGNKAAMLPYEKQKMLSEILKNRASYMENGGMDSYGGAGQAVNLQPEYSYMDKVGAVISAINPANSLFIPSAPTYVPTPEIQPSSVSPGTVMDGHVFIGGDPSNQSNWLPQ